MKRSLVGPANIRGTSFKWIAIHDAHRWVGDRRIKGGHGLLHLYLRTLIGVSAPIVSLRPAMRKMVHLQGTGAGMNPIPQCD